MSFHYMGGSGFNEYHRGPYIETNLVDILIFPNHPGVDQPGESFSRETLSGQDY
jgi:hypothetical protein